MHCCRPANMRHCRQSAQDAACGGNVTSLQCRCRPVQALVSDRGQLVHEQGESWVLPARTLPASELKVLADASDVSSQSRMQ